MTKLHPEITKVLDSFNGALKSFGLTDIHAGGVTKARAFSRALKQPIDTLPAAHSIYDKAIPGPAGDIPIRIFRPNDSKNLPVLVWFHGGGWVIGDLDGSESNCRKLAEKTGCAVISVGYRLAPDTPFPGAFEDCLAAVRWTSANAVKLGMDPARIALGGDSAGGNLAACVALAAKQASIPLVFQLLVYPVIDADFNRRSYRENAEGFLLTREAMRWFWDCYLPDAGRRRDPRVSPIHAKDLSGLAPALIITAEFDPLRDEGEAYGDALKQAGVPVITKRYNGMVHVFFNMPTAAPVQEIDAAMDDAVAALRKAFGL